jgi:hypothetical protein
VGRLRELSGASAMTQHEAMPETIWAYKVRSLIPLGYTGFWDEHNAKKATAERYIRSDLDAQRRKELADALDKCDSAEATLDWCYRVQAYLRGALVAFGE